MTHATKFLLFSILCAVPFVAQTIQKTYSARLTAQSDVVHAEARQAQDDARKAEEKPFTVDPQYASGEWMIQVQTPPCDGVNNVEVIYPRESGDPISIECNSMPVGTRDSTPATVDQSPGTPQTSPDSGPEPARIASRKPRT